MRIALDTDILSLLLQGDPAIYAKLSIVAPVDQCLPITVVEQTLEGRLLTVRRAEAGQGRIAIDVAYDRLLATLEDLNHFVILPYTPAAEQFFANWQSLAKIVGVKDVRIAATAMAHGAKLVTRNSKDFARLPGLNYEIW